MVPSMFGRRRYLVLAALFVLSAAGATFGFAAKLDVSSKGLTDVKGASKVPISTCTAVATADTYVDEAAPTTTYGSATTIKVRSQQNANQRSLIRVDLAGCSIPQNASVKTARLDLYLVTAPSNSRSYGTHAASASWDEATATWNAQPAAATTPTATTATGTSAGVTLSWDVVADVRAFVSGTGTNNGWLLKDQSEAAADPGVAGEFASREDTSAARRPTLVISYYP